MNKRGGKKHKKVRKEVDSFIYEKEIKEIDSFLEEEKEKKKRIKENKNKKFSNGDIIFVVVYLIILFLLLLITPVWESYGSVDIVNVFLWQNIFLILLYIILVPIIYLLIRWNLHRKKEND